MHRRRAPPTLSPTVNSSGTDNAANRVNTIDIIHSFESSANPARPIRPSPLTTQDGMSLGLLDRLRSFPLFVSAPEEFLSAVARHLRPQQHSPRDYILTEGDDAKAMYWLVRGAVAVTSRDGESTYAELRPGAFFGEIGILMNIPRTATIIARSRCLLVVLTKEALQRELPNFPEVERAIREEAEERLTLLNKKKKEREANRTGGVKRSVDSDGDLDLYDGEQPSPAGNGIGAQGLTPGGHWASASALASVAVNIRQLLKELPLFANLPPENLHFLGLSAQPRAFGPFTSIIQQNSHGREIYFIVRGEVEVVDESDPAQVRVKARLKKGHYFGEVAGLSLAPKRTATVRSVTYVECLVIVGDVLAELWKKCPPEVQQQLENTARTRLISGDDEVLGGTTPSIMGNNNNNGSLTVATPAASQTLAEEMDTSDHPNLQVPTPHLSLTRPGSPHKFTASNDINLVEPFDPDPYLPTDFDAMVRSKSRRGSLAPPAPLSSGGASSPTEDKSPSPLATPAPSPVKPKHVTTPPEKSPAKRPKTGGVRIISRKPSRFNIGQFVDDILLEIFKHLALPELMRMRAVSTHWSRLLTTSPHLMGVLNLKPYNRVINDRVIVESIAPFVGHRPHTIDISNCFHISDEGFTVLAQHCGANVKNWKMKSVWDITGQAILEMANRAKGLEEIDLSNCRKVSDTLLARVVGWVVPEFHPMYAEAHQQQLQAAAAAAQGNPSRYIPPPQYHQQPLIYPPAGTVIGCPNLRRLTLSYCKHVTDRTMSHLAAHASKRLEHIDLTRCTTITDQGFQSWSMTRFDRLQSLCLADCTYLTDSAVVFLTNAAKGLRNLDLVSSLPFRFLIVIFLIAGLEYTEFLLCTIRYGNRSTFFGLPASFYTQTIVLR
jgi:F-box/leucine-rich repeat protein 7